MSLHRARPDRGYVDAASLPKGPNGRALCRYCQTEVPPGKRTFCGPPCIHEWKVRSNPGYARACVLKRDRGKCAECGETRFVTRKSARYGCDVSVKQWEMDHIKPVSEGGGSCGLDNLRTLCVPCHRKATAELAGRRATAKRAAR